MGKMPMLLDVTAKMAVLRVMGRMPMLRAVTAKMVVLRAAAVFFLFWWAEGP